MLVHSVLGIGILREKLDGEREVYLAQYWTGETFRVYSDCSLGTDVVGQPSLSLSYCYHYVQ